MTNILINKNNKIISIVLIILLIVTFILMSYTMAFGVVAVATPLLVVGTVLLALGVYSFTTDTSFTETVTNIYNGLSDTTKQALMKQQVIIGTAIQLGNNLYNEIVNTIYNVLGIDGLSQSVVSSTPVTKNNVVGGKALLNPKQYILDNYTDKPHEGNYISYYCPLQDYFIPRTSTGWQMLNGDTWMDTNGSSGDSLGGDYCRLYYEYGEFKTMYFSFYPLPQFWVNTVVPAVLFTYGYSTDVYHYYSLKAGDKVYDLRQSVTNQIITGSETATIGNTFDATYFPDTWVDNLVNDNSVSPDDIALNVGTNAIDGFTELPVIPVSSIDELNEYTPSDILDYPTNDVVVDIGTGSISAEGEIAGDGTGSGIFGNIGKFILSIPILGSILQLLMNILDAIQNLTAVSDFTIDFSPLKVNLTQVFPFCIPFDMLRMVTVYSATPNDFIFSIDLVTDYFVIDHDVDLTPFRIPIIFFRWVVTIWFTWILISRTRDLIKW